MSQLIANEDNTELSRLAAEEVSNERMNPNFFCYTLFAVSSSVNFINVVDNIEDCLLTDLPVA